jgi:hypothetical protein
MRFDYQAMRFLRPTNGKGKHVDIPLHSGTIPRSPLVVVPMAFTGEVRMLILLILSKADRSMRMNEMGKGKREQLTRPLFGTNDQSDLMKVT